MLMSALGVLVAEEQQLGDDEVGHVVVDLPADEDDPVAQQAGVDIVTPLAAPRLLDNDRNEVVVACCHENTHLQMGSKRTGNGGMNGSRRARPVCSVHSLFPIPHSLFLLRFLRHDLVDEPVFEGLGRREVAIAFGFLGDLLGRPAGVVGPAAR